MQHVISSEGLENPDSYIACSYGAGWVMSRIKAIRELNLKKEKRKLDEQRIIHSIRERSDLEEAA